MSPFEETDMNKLQEAEDNSQFKTKVMEALVKISDAVISLKSDIKNFKEHIDLKMRAGKF